jgi:hypothetical protein
MASTLTRKRKAPAPAEATGRVELEMPEELRAELDRLAKERGVALEELITTELTKAIGRDLVDPSGHHGHQGHLPGEEHLSRPLTGLALGINLAVVSFAGALAIVLLLVALGDAL